MSRKQLALFEPVLPRTGANGCRKKIKPTRPGRNPVMFVVWAGSVLTTR